VPELLDTLLAWLLTLSPSTVYMVVGGLSALENVFPPVPADTAVGVGAFLSHRGSVSALAVFAVTLASNIVAATAVYLAGRLLGRPFFTGRLGRRLLRPDRLARIERLYDDYGIWGIFFSRFVPGVRAVVPPFAGIAGLSAPRALIPMIAASAIWYGLLTAVIASAAGQIEDVVRLVARLNWSLFAVAIIAGAFLAFAVHMRKHRP
jgi:membrane protein DedA with SNARE-associated domain